MKLVLSAITVLMLVAPAAQACAPTAISYDWNFASGDQRVSGDYIAELVSGNRVRFVDGSFEHYRRNGSYVFNDGQGTTYDPDGYRFYADGSRCLNYGQPRYDMYVVNGGQLILINQNGDRFQTTVSRR